MEADQKQVLGRQFQLSSVLTTTTTTTTTTPTTTTTMRSIIQQIITYSMDYPIAAALLVFSLICITTRIITGIQYRIAISRVTSTSKSTSTSESTSTSPSPSPSTSASTSASASAPPTLPYSLPRLGHAISFALGQTDYLTRTAQRLGANSSIFALMIGTTKHNIVTIPSLAQQILNDRHAPVSMEPFILRAMEYVWDDRGSTRAVDPVHLWGPIHGVLGGMLRERFVGRAIAVTVGMVGERTWNLVSGCESLVDQSCWERMGGVCVVSSREGGGAGGGEKENHDSIHKHKHKHINNSIGNNNNNSKSNTPLTLTAEANLHALTRYFVSDIASTALFGRNFMTNYPNAMADLWEMDSRFNLFIAGVPGWLPGMTGPALARERLIAAVEDHHAALLKYLDGEDPEYKWDDMSDVSSVIVDRALAFRNAGASSRAAATADAAVLWAMNINANHVVFWLLWYIYSTEGLLEQIRGEIAPYVKLQKPMATGLPIQEAPKLDIDIDGLWTKCPLLKGAFFETMRLESHSLSYKEVEADFVVTESEEDARLLGVTQGPRSWLLRKGEVVCIPHGVHQTDERWFREPQRFDPRRFWSKSDGKEVDNGSEKSDGGETKDEGHGHGGQDDSPHIRVDYGSMRVWGGGKHICKGKTFAEREVVLFAAAILMHWDMVPVANDSKWVHPGRKPGSGTVSPKKDVRVRLSRREEW